MKWLLLRCSAILFVGAMFGTVFLFFPSVGGYLIAGFLGALLLFLVFLPYQQVGFWLADLSFASCITAWRLATHMLQTDPKRFRALLTPSSFSCSACGGVLQEGAHYCVFCGTPTSEEYAGKPCLHCDSLVPLDARYCPICRFKMSVTTSTPVVKKPLVKVRLQPAPPPDDFLLDQPHTSGIRKNSLEALTSLIQTQEHQIS